MKNAVGREIPDFLLAGGREVYQGKNYMDGKYIQKASPKTRRYEKVRHTFATVALQNGIDVKTVSSMLGHYDAGFTLRTYTHATRQVQNQAAETIGNFMAQVM